MIPITGVPIVDWFLGLLDSWGYVLVTFFTVSENLFLIGSFTPGETMVIVAAFVTTTEGGSLWLPLVWTCSVAGTVIGSNLSYLLGRRGGRDVLIKYGHHFHITEERIAEAEAYFHVYGSKTIFFSRFATGLKNFVPVIAGASRMSLLHFQGWTLLSAVTYTSVMCAIGIFVGENFDRALAIARGFGVFGLALLAGIIAALLFGRRRYFAHRREEILEEYVHEHAEDQTEHVAQDGHVASGVDHTDSPQDASGVDHAGSPQDAGGVQHTDSPQDAGSGKSGEGKR